MSWSPRPFTRAPAEILEFPHRPASRARVLDDLARALRSSADRLALPTARAAAAFVDAKGWRTFGDASLDDHAREHLGRSGRWVREQARLHEAITRFPALAAALTGADEGSPLGSESAKLIARVAAPHDVHAWIAGARSTTLTALRRQVRAAVPSADDLEPRCEVTLELPAEVALAFEEVCELARATAGSELSIAEAVEAIVAEAEPPAGEPAPPAVLEAPATSVSWSASSTLAPLEGPADDADVVRRARSTLEEFRYLDACAGRGAPRELQRQLRRLIALEDTLMRRLGDVVAELSDRGAWAELGFVGIRDYAERRLGLAATTVEDRVRVAHALSRKPLLRAAYDAGRLTLEKALLALRGIGHSGGNTATESAWLQRTADATVKRLRDEVRLIGRRREPSRMPLTDEEWAAGIRREPGDTRRRVLALGLEAANKTGPLVLERLRLPESTAERLLAAIESARRGLTELVETVPWDEPWPHAASMPSVLAARTFSSRGRRVPAWAGFLALLEDAAMTWDDPRAIPRRAGDDVYQRSGYRCEAPGCTARRNLQEHHVVFRSRGGGDELSNRVTLCEAHHLALHESGTLQAEGAAPLDLTWTKAGVRYRCERTASEE